MNENRGTDKQKQRQAEIKHQPAASSDTCLPTLQGHTCPFGSSNSNSAGSSNNNSCQQEQPDHPCSTPKLRLALEIQNHAQSSHQLAFKHRSSSFKQFRHPVPASK
eukprot:15471303-Alexandrium_andersonii.AAC.1